MAFPLTEVSKFLCRPSFLAPSAAAIVVMSFLSAPVANAQGTSRDSARVAIDTVEIVGRIDDLRGVALSASEGRGGHGTCDFGRSRGRENCSRRCLG